MKKLLLLLLLLPILSFAQVAKDTVSVITDAQITTGVLNDTVKMYYIQNGSWKKSAMSAIKAFIQSSSTAGFGLKDTLSVLSVDTSAIVSKSFLSNQGYTNNVGTVRSVSFLMPSGFSVSGTPLVDSGTIVVSTGLTGLLRADSLGFLTGQANLATEVFGTLPIANGGTGATTSSAALTNLGATTIGSNLVTLTNPSAITFPRFNANNTVSSLTATDFRTAIGAGTGNGTVTSVGATSPVASTGGNAPLISLASGYGDTQNPYASKTANFVLAAPNGTNGVPTFRAIVANDIPTLNQNTTGTASNVTGTVAIVNGGTGQTTANAALNALLPSQTGNNGKYLQTTGTNSQWASDTLCLIIACSDETSNLTTGTAKVTFRAPYAMTVTAVKANVNTAPAGSTIIVDINEEGTSILGTKLSIDADEKTSVTAASAATITDSTIANDAEMTIDIDQIGSSTAGKGLKVHIYYIKG
jgi:hypothetical protein